VQLPDELLVRVGAFVEQKLDQIERGHLVGMIRPEPRAVARPRVGRPIVRVDGE